MYAKVILSLKNKEVDKMFDYAVPEQMEPLSVGVRVIVPFGKGNKPTEGYVVEKMEKTDIPFEKIKSILNVLDEGSPIFTKQMLLLAKWMQKKYICTLSQCLQTMMPAGIKTKIQWQIYLKKEAEEGVFLSSVEKNLISFLKQSQKPVWIAEAEEALGETVQSAIQSLKEKDIIGLFQKVQQKKYEKQVTYFALSEDDTIIAQAWEKVKNNQQLLGQKKLMQYLADGKQATAQQIKQVLHLTDSPIKTLLKKGVLKQMKKVEKRQILQTDVL